MILRTPHYYKNFTCIGSECKDNCCIGGWEIDIDDETWEYYKSVPGEFGDKLRASIIEEEGDRYFDLQDGNRCPFLDKCGLCEVYKHLGEKHLGVVCDQFPRFSEYYGVVKETGIGLACEEAERIIFSDKAAFSYDEKELDEEQNIDAEFDSMLAKSLFIYRDTVIKLFDGECLNFTDKLRAMLYSADYIQGLINTNAYDEIASYVDSLDLTSVLSEIPCDNSEVDFTASEGVYRVLCAYEELEVLNPAWSSALEEVFEVLHREELAKEENGDIASNDENAVNDNITAENDKYLQISRELITYLRANNRLYEYDNLLKYYVFRYFMKASYDHDILGKAVLAIANWLVIRDMDIVRYLKNGKIFSFENRIDTVHIFSRQVEYSEDNLWALSEEFMFDEIFAAEELGELLKMVGEKCSRSDSGLAAFESLEKAASNLPDMTIEDINKEISAARAERKEVK